MRTRLETVRFGALDQQLCVSPIEGDKVRIVFGRLAAMNNIASLQFLESDFRIVSFKTHQNRFLPHYFKLCIHKYPYFPNVKRTNIFLVPNSTQITVPKNWSNSFNYDLDASAVIQFHDTLWAILLNKFYFKCNINMVRTRQVTRQKYLSKYSVRLIKAGIYEIIYNFYLKLYGLLDTKCYQNYAQSHIRTYSKARLKITTSGRNLLI